MMSDVITTAAAEATVRCPISSVSARDTEQWSRKNDDYSTTDSYGRMSWKKERTVEDIKHDHERSLNEWTSISTRTVFIYEEVIKVIWQDNMLHMYPADENIEHLDNSLFTDA